MASSVPLQVLGRLPLTVLLLFQVELQRQNAALRSALRAAAGVAVRLAPYLQGVPPEGVDHLRWLLTVGVGLASAEPAPNCPVFTQPPPAV